MDLFFSTLLNGVWLAAVIQRHLFLSFFFFLLMFNCLPTLLPVSAWLKPHGNKRQLELQPAKACTESGARFWVLIIFSWVWCVSSEWKCRDCAVSPQPRPGVLSGQHLKRKKQQKRCCEVVKTWDKSTVLPLVQWLERRERSFILILRGIWGVCGDRHIPCVTQSLQTILLFQSGIKLRIFCRCIYCHSIFKRYDFEALFLIPHLPIRVSDYFSWNICWLFACCYRTLRNKRSVHYPPAAPPPTSWVCQWLRACWKCKLTQFVEGSAHCASCGTLCHCCVHFFIFLSAQSPTGMLMHTSQTSRVRWAGDQFPNSYRKIPKTKQAIFQPARWP